MNASELFPFTCLYFCNSITFTVITEDDKGAHIKIKSVFLHVYHVACQEVLSNGSF